MSVFKKLARQSSHYFVGEFLSVISGLISFPIFTRIFTKEEYGIVSLVTITLTLTNTIISFGLRASIVRFYSLAKKDGEEYVKLLYSTMMLTVVASGTIGIVVLIGIIETGILNFMNPVSQKIISFASVLILYRTTTATIRSFLQCEEKTKLFNVVYVAEKYLGLIFALIFVVYLQLGVTGLFIGLIIGEGLIFIILLTRVLKYLKKDTFKFSKNVLWQNLSYGFPLMTSNLAEFVNNSGSRYLIEYFIGTAAVAIYSVSFNLSAYIQNLLIFTLNKALIPMTMKLWSEQGKDETRQFLTRFVNIYFMASIPIIFGLTAVGRNFLVFVASEKYADSASIIFWIISGLIIQGGYFPLMAGLYLEKKTKIIASTLIIGAFINFSSSVILIPVLGIQGAAISTLLGYSAYIITGYIRSSKYLKVKINYFNLIRYTIFSVIMYFIIIQINGLLASSFLMLIIQTIMGISIYATLLILFDEEAKTAFHSIILPKIVGLLKRDGND